MKYTLTRANPDANQYPLQERQVVSDPLQEEVNKNVFMTRLEDVLHNVVNWGRKIQFGLSTLVRLVVMLNMRQP